MSSFVKENAGESADDLFRWLFSPDEVLPIQTRLRPPLLISRQYGDVDYVWKLLTIPVFNPSSGKNDSIGVPCFGDRYRPSADILQMAILPHHVPLQDREGEPIETYPTTEVKVFDGSTWGINCATSLVLTGDMYQATVDKARGKGGVFDDKEVGGVMADVNHRKTLQALKGLLESTENLANDVADRKLVRGNGEKTVLPIAVEVANPRGKIDSIFLPKPGQIDEGKRVFIFQDGKLTWSAFRIVLHDLLVGSLPDDVVVNVPAVFHKQKSLETTAVYYGAFMPVKALHKTAMIIRKALAQNAGTLQPPEINDLINRLTALQIDGPAGYAEYQERNYQPLPVVKGADAVSKWMKGELYVRPTIVKQTTQITPTPIVHRVVVTETSRPQTSVSRPTTPQLTPIPTPQPEKKKTSPAIAPAPPASYAQTLKKEPVLPKTIFENIDARPSGSTYLIDSQHIKEILPILPDVIKMLGIPMSANLNMSSLGITYKAIDGNTGLMELIIPLSDKPMRAQITLQNDGETVKVVKSEISGLNFIMKKMAEGFLKSLPEKIVNAINLQLNQEKIKGIHVGNEGIVLL